MSDKKNEKRKKNITNSKLLRIIDKKKYENWNIILKTDDKFF